MTDTLEQLRADAAAERAKHVAARAARPRDRRCSEIAGSRPVMRVRSRIELRASGQDDSLLHFTGCASAYEQGYEMWDYWGPYTEVVSAGAGQATLARPDLDVPLVLQHESLRRIARTTNGTLTLAEGDVGDGNQGLLVDAPALDPTDGDVAYIAPKLRSGLVDEMSFMFTITAGQWSPDYMEYRITGYDIHRGDVSIVGYGANPATSAQLRAIAGKLKVGRSLDAQDVNVLTQALGWFASVDAIVDDAQEALAGYLGVPNPDDDEAQQQLAKLTPVQLRAVDRAVRRELTARHIAPAMTLRDVEQALA